jgi:hypothetical protein
MLRASGGAPPRATPAAATPREAGAVNDAVLRVAVATVTGVALAVAWVLARRGFGLYDLAPFAFWTMLFGAWMAWVARRFRDVIERPPGWSRHAGVAAVGAVGALVWTMVVFWTFGPWMMSFNLPIGALWAVAGIVTMLPRPVAETSPGRAG